MKVVYFETRNRGFHPNEGEHVSVFYLPDENVTLYRATSGMSAGRQTFGVSTVKRDLTEARRIAQGKIPKVDGVTYSNIRELEYEDSRLRAIIQDAILKDELESKVKSGIEDLLKYTGKSPEAD